MNKVQCIIVGAGPAGSACGYSLARKGIETVLIERGRNPGDKNIASFVLIPGVLKHLIPDYRDSAPLERVASEFSILQLGAKDLLKLQCKFQSLFNEPVGYTAFRSMFDAWFAQKAKEAGAELITGMTVTDLIKDKGRIIGIKVGDDELFADVVVGADGAHSLVAERSGLVPELDTMKTHLAVKEVLDLPSEVIEERFQFSKDEGCCIHGMSCYPVEDIGGFYSLYTNRDSISLAIFGTVKLLAERHVRLHERLQMLKEHPYLNALISGSTTREYQAHLLSYGGKAKRNKVYADGLLLCGEAGGFLNQLKVGVPTGMLTGMMAAETIELAIRKGDFSSKTLQRYVDFLRSSALLDIVSQTSKYNNYYAQKGILNVPVYHNTALELFEAIIKDQFDFIRKERYPFGKVLYCKIIQDFVPTLLRRPMNLLVRGISRFLNLLKKLKARKNYYEWN